MTDAVELPWQVEAKAAFLASKGVDAYAIAQSACVSGGMYESMLGHYSGRRAALAPDRYGAGGSDAAPRQLSMEEYAVGVVDVLDACNVEKAAVLGTHTGAFEAVALAGFTEREARRFFGRPRHIDGLDLEPIPPEAAKKRFLDRFGDLAPATPAT